MNIQNPWIFQATELGLILHERPSKLLNLKKSEVELLNIDYEIMRQYFSLMQEEKTSEEKIVLVRKMREEIKLGGSTRSG